MWKHLKGLGKHTAIYGIGNAAISVLSFLLVPLYTHNMSTAEFGTYSLMLILYNVLSLVADFGLTSSISRYYFDKLDETEESNLARYRQTLISTALATAAVISVSLSLICYLSAGWVARRVFGVAGYEEFIKIVAAALLFRGLTAAPMIYLRVCERAVTYTVLTFLQIALFLILNIVFVATLKLGVSGVLYALLASTAIYAALLIGSIAGDLRPRVEGIVARELLKFGLPFLPVLLFMWVIDFSDRYLLDRYTTVSEVGVYSLGYKFGQFMMFVVTAFSLGWVPIRFQMLTLDEPEVAYGRVATFYVAGAGLVWLVLAAFSREMIVWTSPQEFHRASTFIAPVAFGYLLYGLFVVSVTGMGVAKKAASLFFVVLAAAAINIGLNILLIPRIGAMAAAYATIIAYAAMVAGSLYFSQRLYPIAYEYRRCAMLLISMIALAILATLASDLPLALNITAKVFLVGLYAGVVLMLGVLRKAELLRLVELISSYSPHPIRAGLNDYAKRKLQPRLADVELTQP